MKASLKVTEGAVRIFLENPLSSARNRPEPVAAPYEQELDGDDWGIGSGSSKEGITNGVFVITPQEDGKLRVFTDGTQSDYKAVTAYESYHFYTIESNAVTVTCGW